MDYVDEGFTKNYLDLLKSFATFLVTYKGNLPQSRNFQLCTFVDVLKTQCTQALKIVNAQKRLNKVISIDPNVIFGYTNPEDKSRKFYISIGGYVKFEDSVLIEQSLTVNVILEHTTDCAPVPEEWKWHKHPIDNGFHVLRRFHFDYDSTNDDNHSPKFHLQYGGKFNKNYLGIGDEDAYYNLFQPIDYPRLPQQPFDMIMLIDFVLREFSLKGNEITREKKWNELLVKSEQMWLKPYYEHLIGRLDVSSRLEPVHRILGG